MSQSDISVWQSVVDAIPDVETWNRNLPELRRLVEKYGPECKEFFAKTAQGRGYVWSSSEKQYFHPWELKACNHPGKNVIGAGWRSGRLAVIFAAEPLSRRYESVDEVPREVYEKLIRSLYPDKLFTQIVKGKYELRKVE